MIHKQVAFSLPSDVLQAFKEPVGALEKKFRLYLAIMLYREAELGTQKRTGKYIDDNIQFQPLNRIFED